MAEKRVLIMAGGTGGHVFPALAVARELARRGMAVEWLGTGAGIEAELVPENQLPLHCIQVTGVRGKGRLTLLLAPLRIVRAVWQALAVIRKVQPDAVIGFGGFVSGPGGVAAWLKRIPLLIHEQNAVAGTTNRLLSGIASRALQAFPNTLKNAVWTGNPVRDEIARLPDPDQRDVGGHRPLRLLVLGGSLGALAINTLVPEALALMPEGLRPEIRHQCGRKHREHTVDAYRRAGVDASVEPFISDMAAAYGWADFVICRAGALTVAELTAAGIGALLIPFPAAIDDHQTRNGEWLVESGAGLLIQQRDLTAEALAEQLTVLFNDTARLADMARRSRQLAKPQAAAEVASICSEVMA